jgi:hypothetical protein
MIRTINDAKKMDLILSYLVENDTARVKYKQIGDLLGIGLEEARYLHESILKYHHEVEPVIGIHHASNISKKPLVTEEFLKKGGFLAVFKQQMEKEIMAKSHQRESKSKLSKKDWKAKTYWLTFGLALAGFLLATISLLMVLKIIKIGQ